MQQVRQVEVGSTLCSVFPRVQTASRNVRQSIHLASRNVPQSIHLAYLTCPLLFFLPFSRAMPQDTDMSTLPDIWTCEMNTDIAHNHCAAAEEKYAQDNAQVRDYLKITVKRLKNADKAEARLPPSAVTRGRKRSLEVEWIRCCNPSCGKWRAIALRGLDSGAMLKRLNRGKGRWSGSGGKPQWFCTMNTWDESRASCVSPQEPLWDCTWNF